ncbi:hypothetical protein A3A71_03300 [Candidatus Berkelbacteria bacterium RIFCSPLOWO2_01_FULL_50_28]|uniref:Uncharacterized protein n=1 Tax=Candidatus Berkelbacteria bacterium RIFCSPLOWO2_01_FULL_50_28 TaxID=1797471 RepID=A0A1F5ECF6_9BACT|nr:MAG: hypothetical protein A2807_02865 [Candidatus Berkelbacteria bacterium RIFCSPHIGHO2_01_FULL_50_36]OGD65087.1 MAG: hypothetical protein A3A71_03300 [Candidatus Berkelbacteria bacterium RIFCSPLOWO2_01_FULL_50_28]
MTPIQSPFLDFPGSFQADAKYPRLEAVTRRIYDHEAVNLVHPDRSIDNMVRASLLFTVCFYGNLLGCLRGYLSALPEHPFAVQEDGTFLHLLLSLSDEELSTNNIPTKRTECGPHYVAMLEAAQDAGIDTGPIEALVASVAAGNLQILMKREGFHPKAIDYMVFSESCAGTYQRALSTVALRELTLTTAFDNLEKAILKINDPRFDRYCAFLRAHIQLDGDTHGPIMKQALSLVDNITTSIDTMIHFYERRLGVYNVCLADEKLY